MAGSTGPGGPPLSSAKKRRLAALDKRSGAPAAKRPTPAPSTSTPAPSGAASVPSAAAPGPSLPRPDSSTALSGGGVPEWVYAPLAETAASGPAAAPLGLRAAAQGGSVATVLESLMATNPRASDARAVSGGKLRDRTLLLDNPAVARQQGRRSGGGANLTAGLASRKEQRRQGMYNLKNAPNLTFASLQNMHRRWQEYAHGLVHPAQTLKDAAAAALGADLHGALLRVSEAPEARLVGARGIVVRDTAGAFFLVTPEDRVMTVPKAPGFVFELTLGGRQVVTLLGSGLAEASKRAVAASGSKKRGKR